MLDCAESKWSWDNTFIRSIENCSLLRHYFILDIFTLRVSDVGDRESNVGDMESNVGDMESNVGDMESNVGDRESNVASICMHAIL